jgi:hypothetical protein
VKFGSFLGATNGANAVPSPNTYRIKTEYFSDRRGGKMAAKLPTEIDLVSKKKTPGPGTYKLDATSIKSDGIYVLSTYHNFNSPKYLSPKNKCSSPRNTTIGPGQCTIYPNIDDITQ